MRADVVDFHRRGPLVVSREPELRGPPLIFRGVFDLFLVLFAVHVRLEVRAGPHNLVAKVAFQLAVLAINLMDDIRPVRLLDRIQLLVCFRLTCSGCTAFFFGIHWTLR